MIEVIGVGVVAAVVIGYLFYKHTQDKKAVAPIIAQGDIAGARWIAYVAWCTANNMTVGSIDSQVYWTTH